MSLIYKIYAYSDERELVGYDVKLNGDLVLFTEEQLLEIKSKPLEEQESYALSLIPS